MMIVVTPNKLMIWMGYLMADVGRDAELCKKDVIYTRSSSNFAYISMNNSVNPSWAVFDFFEILDFVSWRAPPDLFS